MIDNIAQVITLVGALIAVLGAWWRIDTTRMRLEDKIDALRSEQDMARHSIIDKRVMPKLAEIDTDIAKNGDRLDRHSERIAKLERNGGRHGD